MGVIRVVGALALVVACDKGNVEPAKGSAQPPPAPVPVAPTAIDAMSVDEQLLRGQAPSPDSVKVRACNDTGKDMTALAYHGFTEGALRKGECTPYRETKHAYGYTNAKFEIEKREFTIQPIDYVGETPLDAGWWSYHIKVEDWTNRYADIRASRDVDGSGAPTAREDK